MDIYKYIRYIIVIDEARYRSWEDSQIREFERRDLGKDIMRSKSMVVIKPKKVSTSIILDPSLITQLHEKAKKRGIGYQTMLKMIVYEHLDEY